MTDPLDLEPIRGRLSALRKARAGRGEFHASVGATLAFNAHAARDVEVLAEEVERLRARVEHLADRVTATEGREEPRLMQSALAGGDGAR